MITFIKKPYDFMPLRVKAASFAILSYKKIPKEKLIPSGLHLANSNCHYNAVQAVLAKRANKVWMCLSGNSKDVVVHFINSNEEGNYFDDTWGSGVQNKNYWVIREITPDEFEEIYEILVSTKRHITYLFGTESDKINFEKDNHGAL